jgi:hypothetical protein
MLQADFAHSREIHYREWQRRSLLHRLMEWLWGKIDIRLAQWRPHIRDTARDTPERSPDSEDGRH